MDGVYIDFNFSEETVSSSKIIFLPQLWQCLFEFSTFAREISRRKRNRDMTNPHNVRIISTTGKKNGPATSLEETLLKRNFYLMERNCLCLRSEPRLAYLYMSTRGTLTEQSQSRHRNRDVWISKSISQYITPCDPINIQFLPTTNRRFTRQVGDHEQPRMKRTVKKIFLGIKRLF